MVQGVAYAGSTTGQNGLNTSQGYTTTLQYGNGSQGPGEKGYYRAYFLTN